MSMNVLGDSSGVLPTFACRGRSWALATSRHHPDSRLVEPASQARFHHWNISTTGPSVLTNGPLAFHLPFSFVTFASVSPSLSDPFFSSSSTPHFLLLFSTLTMASPGLLQDARGHSPAPAHSWLLCLCHSTYSLRPSGDKALSLPPAVSTPRKICSAECWLGKFWKTLCALLPGSTQLWMLQS